MEYPKEDNSVQKTRKNLTKPISPIRHPIIEKPKHSKKNESDDQKFISQTPILKKKNKTKDLINQTSIENQYESQKQKKNLIHDSSYRITPAKQSNTLINKAFFNHFELSQKAKSIKRHSNPSILHKLIKKSLLKEKYNKLNKEKESKVLSLLMDIKKKEASYQNKQIRIQNSEKPKKKLTTKKSRNKSLAKKMNFSNICTLKTDSSNKLKVSDSLSYKKFNKNLRSKSSADHYHSNTYDSAFSPYVLYKKPHSKENLKKGSLKETKNKYKTEKDLKYEKKLLPNKNLSSVDGFSDYSESENSQKKGLIDNKNFGIVFANNSEIFNDYSFVDNKNVDEFERFSDKDESPYQNNFVSFDHAAKIIQKNYRKYLVKKKRNKFEIETFCGFSVKPKEKSKLSVEIQKTLPLFYQKKRNLAVEHLTTNSIVISPDFKLKLDLNHKSSQIVEEKKLLEVENPSMMSFIPQASENYKSQWLDQFSLTKASISMVENLKNSEISTILKLSNFIPAELKDVILKNIEKKYSSLLTSLNFYKETNENMLVFEKNSKVLKCKTRKIKEDFERPFKEYSQTLSSLLETNEESSPGISHSKSLASLYEDDFFQKMLIKDAESMISNPFFSESSSKNSHTEGNLFIQPELSSKNVVPQMPLLNLSLKPVEYEPSDPRKLIGIEFIKKYLSKVFLSLDSSKVLNELSKPITKDPLKELDKVQELQIGTPTDSQILSFSEVFSIKSTLETVEIEEGSTSKDQQLLKSDKIHRKMILEGLNFLLQQFRPFGYKGLPFPWENNGKYGQVLRAKLSFSIIIDKVFADFEYFSSFEIGKVSEIQSSIGIENESQVIKDKEKMLDLLIFQEYFAEEYIWTDYKFEEIQVKFDLSDMVLNTLSEELINILNN